MVIVRKRSGDSPRFDDECTAAFNRKRTAYRRWFGGSCSNVDWDLFVGAPTDEEAFYASARARNCEQCVAILQASLCHSHRWRALNC